MPSTPKNIFYTLVIVSAISLFLYGIAQRMANKLNGITIHIGIYTINVPPVSPFNSIFCAMMEQIVVIKIHIKNKNMPILRSTKRVLSSCSPLHLTLRNTKIEIDKYIHTNCPKIFSH